MESTAVNRLVTTFCTGAMTADEILEEKMTSFFPLMNFIVLATCAKPAAHYYKTEKESGAPISLTSIAWTALTAASA